MAPSHRKPLPWSRSCFVCGEDNPLGLRARSFLVGDQVELEFSPRPEYAGKVFFGAWIELEDDDENTYLLSSVANSTVAT